MMKKNMKEVFYIHIDVLMPIDNKFTFKTRQQI